ncbi:MAG TPA: hypothetical protein V6C86_03840 [Oculatellaceae cyanobacterium]
MTATEVDKVPVSAKPTLLPDVGDIIFLAVIFLTLFLRPNLVFGDGSTGWHLATGDYVLDHNFLPPSTDLFSWTKSGEPWVAYEWLSDTIMAIFVRVGGLPLLGVAVCSMIASISLLIYEKMRREGCHFFTALWLTIVGALASAVHWLARPHLFTFLGIYIFSTRLEDRYKGTVNGARFYLPISLYMLIWVNCHPGFLFGLALIGLYAACSLVAAAVYAAEKRLEFLGKAKDFVIAFASCVAISFINPYGIKLYEYILQYFKDSEVIQATNEFLPPNFHGQLSPLCLAVLYAALILGLAIGRRRLTFAKLMACLVFAFLALLSVRHMPLFSIIALPAIGELFARVRPISQAQNIAGAEDGDSPLPMAGWWQAVVSKFREIGEGFNENEALCQSHIVSIGAVVLLSLVAIFGKSTQIVTSTFDPEDKPMFQEQVAPGKPAGTLNYLFEHERKGDLKPESGISYDNWGGYLFWMGQRQSPPIVQKVFIDDRADFYGETHYKKYALVSQVDPGFDTLLKDYKLNWVLFPFNSRIVDALKKSPDWQEAARDKASVLMVRKQKLYCN